MVWSVTAMLDLSLPFWVSPLPASFSRLSVATWSLQPEILSFSLKQLLEAVRHILEGYGLVKFF